VSWSIIDIVSRNWAIVLIACTIITLVVVPAFIILKYVRISLNIMRTTVPPLARNPLDFVRLEGEEINFPARDGLPLNGMLIHAEPSAPRRGTILFAHEFGSDMYSAARYCRGLQAIGYDVLTFDFRGHGSSPCPPEYTPRQWPTDRELDDIRGALGYTLTYLREKNLPEEVGVVGVSRGAGAAILVAQEYPAIRAVFCDGVFSTDATIEHFMKRWAYIFASMRVLYENHHPNFWRFLRWCMFLFARREFRCRFPSVRKAIQRMQPRPVFFVHGQRDSYLPVEQSRLLYALAPQPKFLWIAPDARHSQAVVLHPETYTELITGFFNDYLQSGERESTAPRSEAPRPAGQGVS
jgi:pimeloyl-ACP methyl ester carboxylesterase